MGRFDNLREQISNTSRGAWLALGLIVVAGLVALTFALGEPDELADTDADEPAPEEEARDEEDNGVEEDEEERREEDEDEEEAREDEEVADEEEEEVLPGELAETGPGAAMAAVLFGASGYYFFRSRKQLHEVQRSDSDS